MLISFILEMLEIIESISKNAQKELHVSMASVPDEIYHMITKLHTGHWNAHKVKIATS